MVATSIEVRPSTPVVAVKPVMFSIARPSSFAFSSSPTAASERRLPAGGKVSLKIGPAQASMKLLRRRERQQLIAFLFAELLLEESIELFRRHAAPRRHSSSLHVLIPSKQQTLLLFHAIGPADILFDIALNRRPIGKLLRELLK
jgi:hypothetical protein